MRLIFAFLLTVSVANAGSLENYIQQKNPKLSKHTVHAVAVELRKYPKPITHIAERESTFDPHARSCGNVGLMGINVKVWFSSDPKYNLVKLGILQHKQDVFTIRGNLKAGFYIWKHCKKNYRRYRGCLP